MSRLALVTSVFALLAGSATAHEYWLDPEVFAIPTDGRVVAHTRVGQDFEGQSFSYLPARTVRFDYALDGEVTAIPGRVGDRPAIGMDAPGEGLVVLVAETTDSVLTYDDFADFVSFVDHKDAMWTIDAHAERGLSEEKLKEMYSRYAKSLVAVGDGAGSDMRVGLETEIVALGNPYTDDISDGIEVRVFYGDDVRADAQVEVFEKAPDGGVSITMLTTDDTGTVAVPVKAGHRYMLDAVVLREPAAAEAAENGAVWESLWANLTFGVPE